MKTSPLISVILPVYNAEFFVGDTIISILNQTCIDFELIILNDCSNDGSEDVILRFTDKRIRYIKNEVNLKLIRTLNLGFSIARGKYIARMDADDIAIENRFQKQVDFLDKHFEYGIVGSFAQTFGGTSSLLEFVSEDEEIRYALLSYNPFIHSSVMLRSSVIHSNNLTFDLSKKHVEDYDLWTRLLQYTKGKILPEILIKYRVHDHQISKIHIDEQIERSKQIQSNYLNSILALVGEFDDFYNLFYQQTLSIFKLVSIINLIEQHLSINKCTNLQSQVYKVMLKRAKNQILTKESFAFSEVRSLLSIFNLFTFRQKISLLKKLI
jgi:glycosyltransferase involved in cell wall biosynthesis